MTLQEFLNARGIAYTENENGLTVGEIIELTRGQYGHDKFAAVFQR